MTSLTHLLKVCVTVGTFLWLTGQPNGQVLPTPDDYEMITKKISSNAIFAALADSTDKPEYLEIYPVKISRTGTASDISLFIVVRTQKGYISTRFGDISTYSYDTLRANYLYYLMLHHVPPADTVGAFQYKLPEKTLLPPDSLVVEVLPFKGIFHVNNPIVPPNPLLTNDSTCCKCPPCYYDIPRLLPTIVHP